jgi:hypothetical protein
MLPALQQRMVGNSFRLAMASNPCVLARGCLTIPETLYSRVKGQKSTAPEGNLAAKKVPLRAIVRGCGQH